MVSTNKKTAVL